MCVIIRLMIIYSRYIRTFNVNVIKITDQLGENIEKNTEAVDVDCKNCKYSGKLVLDQWDKIMNKIIVISLNLKKKVSYQICTPRLEILEYSSITFKSDLYTYLKCTLKYNRKVVYICCIPCHSESDELFSHFELYHIYVFSWHA